MMMGEARDFTRQLPRLARGGIEMVSPFEATVMH